MRQLWSHLTGNSCKHLAENLGGIDCSFLCYRTQCNFVKLLSYVETLNNKMQVVDMWI